MSRNRTLALAGTAGCAVALRALGVAVAQAYAELVEGHPETRPGTRREPCSGPVRRVVGAGV